jgi:hypothetical protein
MHQLERIAHGQDPLPDLHVVGVPELATGRFLASMDILMQCDSMRAWMAGSLTSGAMTISTSGHGLELLEATSADSPVASFIEKRGEGLHHVAYTVDGIDAILESLKRPFQILCPGVDGRLVGDRQLDETTRENLKAKRYSDWLEAWKKNNTIENRLNEDKNSWAIDEVFKRRNA